jgi:phosphoribosyl-AMP cyclohydrolase
VLYSEKERWSPWMDQGDSAGHVVEVLMLREDYCDEDNTDEIVELVDEFDLEYDLDREVDR